MHEITEIWMPVIGYECAYEISDRGSIRTLNRTIIRNNGWPHTTPARILKQSDVNGYLQVGLSLPGYGQKRFSVARILWASFFGKIPIDMVVIHLDGNLHNNFIGNLALATRKQALAHRTKNMHCAQGHEWTADTTRIATDGKRRCRPCAHKKQFEYRNKKSPNRKIRVIPPQGNT